MAADPALLYDQTGTPIPIPGPEKPTRTTVVPAGVNANRNDRFRDYPSRNLKPQRLAAILQQADGGDPSQWIQLLEEMIEKDPKLASVLSTRYGAVLGLDWEVVAARLDDDATQEMRDRADLIAKFCFNVLRATNFQELVGDMLDGIAKPFAIDWIRWGEDEAGNWIPKRFDRIPTRHIHWSFNDDTLRVFEPTTSATGPGGEVGINFQEYTTVRALNTARRDHPTRAGLGRTIAWYVHFKIEIFKAMLAYIDRFGMPVRVLKVDDQDFDNADRFGRFRASLAAMGQDASAIFTKNVELEFEKIAETGGIEVYEVAINLIDKAIAWVVLGHELSSQSSPGAGQLGITASLQVRQDILESDCEFVSGIIRRDVLAPIVGFNFGWDEIDLLPTIYFDYEPARDLAAEAKTIQTIATTFKELSWSKQQLREQFGVEEPLEIPGTEEGAEESDVIFPSAAPSPTAGATPGGDQADIQPAGDPASIPTVNATGRPTVSLAKRPRPAPKYSPRRQKNVDALADRGIALGTSIVDGWKRQIRDAVRTAARAGVPLAEVRRRLVALYEDLDVAELEKSIKEESLKARLYGRNA